MKLFCLLHVRTVSSRSQRLFAFNRQVQALDLSTFGYNATQLDDSFAFLVNIALLICLLHDRMQNAINQTDPIWTAANVRSLNVRTVNLWFIDQFGGISAAKQLSDWRRPATGHHCCQGRLRGSAQHRGDAKQHTSENFRYYRSYQVMQQQMKANSSRVIGVVYLLENDLNAFSVIS